MAGRMTQLREAMGFEFQNVFADWLGIEPNRWNNFERGKPVSNDVAQLLVRKCPGLSLDWIYNGSLTGLSVAMAKRLGELDKRNDDGATGGATGP